MLLTIFLLVACIVSVVVGDVVELSGCPYAETFASDTVYL